MTAVKLSTGFSMPLLGLGTFKIKGKDVIYSALDTALSSGYRSIDTAAVYRNEGDIGNCLKELLPKHNLKREDIFITTKLGPKDQGFGKCRAACLQSIDNLQCSYLDMYLIHWPGAQGFKPNNEMHSDIRLQSWQDMIVLQQEGKIKSIGVSNFLPRHMDGLIQKTQVHPSLLQTEFHPHLVQTELLKYCKDHKIHLQAYSSLGTTTDNNKILNDPTVIKIANKLEVSVARLLLRWAVQQEVGVIPKSCNPQHIAENSDIFSFTISEEDMNILCHLDQQHHYCWDPNTVT